MFFPAIVIALFVAVVACLTGELLRSIIPGLRRLLIPGSVLAGVLALVLGPQGLSLQSRIGVDTQTFDTISRFPPLFITVVFAALMLGRPIAKLSQIWQRARPQVIMGHVYAWGQYVVGLSLTLFLLVPLFNVDPLAGATIAIGFQGGHGTAAGLDSTFAELGFPEGKTVAYALATFGIVAGTVFGPLLANYHRRQQSQAPEDSQPTGNPATDSDATNDAECETPAIQFSPLTGKLTIHLAIVGMVIMVAHTLLQGATTLEKTWRGDNAETLFTPFIPLFSVALIAGFSVQLLLQKAKLGHLINRGTIDLISAAALDLVIFSALATLDLRTLGQSWITIAVLCAGGIIWNLAVYFTLGPRMYSHPWYAFGLGDLGGGTATTASGLLLIRVVDPDNQTRGRLAYTEKQPLYEPFMGGGLVTAFALPVIANLGVGLSLLITAVILIGWLAFAAKLIRN